MRKYLFIITAAFSLSLSIPSIAFSNNLTGITGTDFLKLGAEAKELDMGNAVTSIAVHCAGMIYWNPMAIAALRRKEVSLMHS
ncbi:hypothetical protein ATZ36_11470 [Candidatus Endomicrobiellum trichonymphae]|uniref:Uncharacterized protein n=1 Tax=Endomicrobium trichonymphae TaxID=1408204 RepID=A0A1E5IGH6_ENDTX|nr:hypothetical protein ATZ36_11470 [Candidatus Endomicrobium trichonymphae]